jgi:acetyl-CoA carboxylase biotin carboxyl carrier protein
MNVQDLQKVLQLVEKFNLTEFGLEEKDFKVSVKRGSLPTAVALPTVPAPLPSVAPSASSVASAGTKAEEKDILVIKAPMVGAFYVAPSPESEPYVKIGSVVRPDTTVCILEAMKVMNEVRAECSGEILEVLVKNGAPVEYGQPLFKVRTSA